jgi:4-amino-4-deoxy-L-arabinose transferase-like glycosyltransferase
MQWNNMLYEFYAQNFDRFVHGTRGHEQAFFYYAAKFWIDFAPWSWLAPAAIWWTVRSERWRNPKTQLVLWWFGAFFVFLSVAVTKRQLYLLPAYPAMALLLGPWLASVGRAAEDTPQTLPGPRPVSIYSLVLAIAFAVIGVALCVLAGAFEALVMHIDLGRQRVEDVAELRAPLAVVGVFLLAAGLWIAQTWRRGDTRAGLFRIGVAHIMLYSLILGLVLPGAQPMMSYAPSSAWLKDQIGSEENIGMVWPARGIKKRAAFAFYAGAMVDMLDDRAQVDHFFEEHPGSVVLVYEGMADLIFAANEPALQARVMRNLCAGGYCYRVLGGPATVDRLAGEPE